MPGGFDIYGNYYASERDAMNAESAQMAAISADLAYREQHEDRAYNEQWRAGIEERLARLEEQVAGLLDQAKRAAEKENERER